MNRKEKKDSKVTSKPLRIRATMSTSVTLTVQSHYFLIGRRKLCKKLLNKSHKSKLTEEERLEFLLALHIVLEVGINSFLRSLYSTYTNLDYVKYENVIDEVNYIDKTRMFLSSNRFIFSSGGEKRDAEKRAKKLIQSLIKFGRIRNMIMHGHSLSESSGGAPKQSNLKEILTSESKVDRQVQRFKDIIESFNFFVDRLETSVNEEQIKTLKKNFLDSSFLN